MTTSRTKLAEAKSGNGLESRVEQGEVVVVCRHNQPVAEIRAIETSPAHPARVAGLLKGRIHWEPNAFAPMSVEELAEFDGAPDSPPMGPG